jgi:hypothetical protein
MKNRQLGIRLLTGGVIFLPVAVASSYITFRCCRPITWGGFIAVAASILAYLGWVALGELKRQGKHSLVRSIRMAVLITVGLAIITPNRSIRVDIAIIPCVLMAYAFFIAMRDRNVPTANGDMS